MNKLTMGSLFDGIGGFVLSGNQVGVNTLWSSEIDPCCEAVTKHHFPNVAQLGDITKIDGAKVPPVDIICGGSPCQDLSVAGKRAGLAGARSGLYMEQIRIIREMRKATNGQYPRYMVWENVPGALSSNKGEDFNAVLEEAARCAEDGVSIPQPKKWSNAGNIVGNGWSIAWRILDAQYWGVPQRRRRIFLVADFGSERAGEVLLEQESVRGHSAESGKTWEGIAADVEGSIGRSVYNESGQGYWMPGFGCLRAEGENRASRPNHCVVWPETTGSLLARADSSPCIDRGQPFVVKCLNPNDPQTMRVYDADGLYPALTSNSGGGQNRQAVIYEPKSAFEENWAESKVKNALRAESSKSSHAVVETNDLYIIQGDIARGAHYSQNGKGYTDDGISYTLNTLDCPAVVFTQNQREEVRDLNGVAAALAAESGMHQSNYICEPVAAFMGGQGAKARTIAYSEDISPSLKSAPSGGNTVPDIVYGVDCRNATIESELTHTLQAKPGGGFSLNCTPSVTYSIAGYGNYTESNPTLRASGGDCGGGSEGITLYTMQRNDEFKECGICSTQSARQYKSATDIIAHKKNRKYIIRRLTPLECDRLQGYPDNWSQVPYKGKPMSDSARYRMDGNSVAIPCVVRVLGGIADANYQNV